MGKDIKDKKVIEIIYKIYSSVAYYLPDLTTMEDEKKFKEIMNYILDNIDTIGVEKLTEREYAKLAARVAEKFNLTLDDEAYIYLLLTDEEYENLDYHLQASEFIHELVPGLAKASDEDFSKAIYIMNDWLNLEDPKTITTLELAQVAYVIASELNLEADPRLLDYLEADKSVKN